MLFLYLALSGAPAADPAPATPCPTWGHFFHSPGLCPGTGLYPFERQPRVCLVEVCPCDPAAGTAECKTMPWVKEFSSAAHVEIPRFTVHGDPVRGNCLVIYEGMRLVVDPDSGRYDVTFTATVPDMPVNLRLQFVFRDKAGAAYTLTLPPLRLQPKSDAKPGDPTAWTFHVAHRGYSTLFQKPHLRTNVHRATGSIGPSYVDATWELTRGGTARFGTPVAIETTDR